MENYFIVAGKDSYETLYWLRNTDPVMWCSEKSDAKVYLNMTDADLDIKLNEDTFRLIFESSNMKYINIYEIDKSGNIVQTYTSLKKGL